MAIGIRGMAVAAAMLALGAAAGRVSSQQEPHSYVPGRGFVPDAETAVRVAEAVLIPIYTAQNIDRQKPLTARLEGERWIVEGTLPPDRAGGVARVELAKSDARILRVTHGR